MKNSSNSIYYYPLIHTILGKLLTKPGYKVSAKTMRSGKPSSRCALRRPLQSDLSLYLILPQFMWGDACQEENTMTESEVWGVRGQTGTWGSGWGCLWRWMACCLTRSPALSGLQDELRRKQAHADTRAVFGTQPCTGLCPLNHLLKVNAINTRRENEHHWQRFDKVFPKQRSYIVYTSQSGEHAVWFISKMMQNVN